MYLKLFLTSLQSLILVTVFSSCGIKNKYDNSPHMPYAATKYDVDGLKEAPSFGGQLKPLELVKKQAKKPLLSMDLPISFMADTVTLPYDVYRLVKEANTRNKINGVSNAVQYAANPPYDPYAQGNPQAPAYSAPQNNYPVYPTTPQ